MREIKSDVRERETHTLEISRLTEEIEYTRLSEKIEVKNRSVASCLSGIEKYQTKIDTLREEIDLLEQERSRLKKG